MVDVADYSSAAQVKMSVLGSPLSKLVLLVLLDRLAVIL